MHLSGEILKIDNDIRNGSVVSPGRDGVERRTPRAGNRAVTSTLYTIIETT